MTINRSEVSRALAKAMRSYLALDGANGFKFRWRGSYLNYVWFDVIEPNGARCELEFRTRLSDYEAGIYNGGPDRYRRDCGPLVNVLRKSSGLSGDPVSPELVAAFNAWQAADHAGSLAFMVARPERYGTEAEIRDGASGPLQARDGAFYDGAAHCWRFNSQAA